MLINLLVKIGVAHSNKTSTLEIASSSFRWKRNIFCLAEPRYLQIPFIILNMALSYLISKYKYHFCENKEVS